MRNPITVVIAAIILGFLAACAGMPQVELDQAQAAKEEAEAERASLLASGDWEEAMKSWNEAQEQIGQKSYSQARTSLLTAKSRFQKARDIAASRREQIRNEAEGTKGTIALRYERLKQTARSTRLSAAKKRDLEKAYTNIDVEILKLDKMIEGGLYVEARDHSATVMRLVLEAEQLLR
jgi:hypothetical protein